MTLAKTINKMYVTFSIMTRSIMQSIVMLSVIMLSVAMLSVVAPMNRPNKSECYVTVGCKGLPGTNTVVYWAHL
jgi:hypothetical protein